jgi:hypothetical protein
LGGHGGRVRDVGMRHQWLVRWSVRNLVKMLSAVPGSGLPTRGPDCRKSSHTSQSSVLSSSLRRPHLHGGWRAPASYPTPTPTPAARLHGATSQSSIQSSLAQYKHQRGARRPPPGVGSEHGVSPHPELVGAAQAGVGTDMVPSVLLPRSHCCSLARCHRRSPRRRQTWAFHGCCYCVGSASFPSPPHPHWHHTPHRARPPPCKLVLRPRPLDASGRRWVQCVASSSTPVSSAWENGTNHIV